MITPFKKILVPVDFSDCSRTALAHGIFLAKTFKAELEVFHVYEPPYYVGDVLVQLPDQASVTMHDYIRSQAETLTNEMVDSVVGDDDIALTRTLISGVPYDAIFNKIATEDFDLVVMGTHGRHGLSHLLMGSVAERVVRHARCPVMVVRGDAPAK